MMVYFLENPNPEWMMMVYFLENPNLEWMMMVYSMEHCNLKFGWFTVTPMTWETSAYLRRAKTKHHLAKENKAASGESFTAHLLHSQCSMENAALVLLLKSLFIQTNSILSCLRKCQSFVAGLQTPCLDGLQVHFPNSKWSLIRIYPLVNTQETIEHCHV